MKKKFLVIIIVIIVILIITSLVTSYIDSARVRNSVEPKFTLKIVTEDGYKITYWGLGYKVIRYPSVSPNEPYKNNRGVKYGSWFMKYELLDEQSFAKDINKEDIISDNDLLFTINWRNNKVNCVPVQLQVFDDGYYILYTSYEACPPNANCNLMLTYSKSIRGKHNYDVMKIIQNSVIADDITFTNDNLPEFEIYPGNQEKFYHLITDSNNRYLDEFLQQIKVDLKKCAVPDYK